ncbi:phosphoglycolate phosphatase [Mycolicibacterium novocastrense]|uniref:Phosphoglycolate phosphatase n=1 Tax=Mycolicibacterium novocastrense TaxID=59813 RepID=A0ABQ0KHN3_MYCNV|nr:phosphoglycolate phosphatase [Mycolicibacterium novocastrense]
MPWNVKSAPPSCLANSTASERVVEAWRVAELDLAELRSVTAADVGTSRQAAVTKLAADVMKPLTARC